MKRILSLINPFSNSKKDNYDQELFKTLLIDINTLKLKVSKLEESNSMIISRGFDKITTLTPLEDKIYNIYISKKPKSMRQLSKLSKVKLNSLKVYCSTIRKKGYNISFNKN